MKELIKRIIDQLSEVQLKTIQENIEHDKENWGDYANLNIDEFIISCQEFSEKREITVEDVMAYAKTDWTSNVPSGLPEEEENWLAGKLN